MASQATLFDLPYEAQRDCRDEILRLTGQRRRILDRLLAGPATNHELARIALKYTGRLSEIRAELEPRGWTIECFDQDRRTGVCWYRLARLIEVGRANGASREVVRLG